MSSRQSRDPSQTGKKQRDAPNGFVYQGSLDSYEPFGNPAMLNRDRIRLYLHTLLSQEPRVKIKSTNTILYCRNLEATVEFYRTGLKLPVLSSTEWFLEFKLNETSRVSVADEARTSVKSGGGKGLTLSLQVDDIEQTREELMEAGTTPTPVKEVWGSKVIYIHDPEGNRLEFWSGRAKA